MSTIMSTLFKSKSDIHQETVLCSIKYAYFPEVFTDYLLHVKEN